MAIDTSSSINGVMTTAQYNAQKAATPQSTSMGQSEFLTLFTTQLKNQDPTDPVKNEAFVAQLAQFSQLEATTAMKTSMNSLVSSMSNDRMLGAASLMGKQVAVPDGPVQVTDTTVSQGTINVPAGADGIQLQVFNDKGILVRTQIMGAQKPGDVTLAWDGMTDGGQPAVNGTYRYVATVNSQGVMSKPTVNTYATVTGVSSAGTSDGTMLLEVAGGKTVNLADVKRIVN
ncbi:flagellar hook capping FlgD N-terminal domain-containing protein [Limnohabitans sp.]|uniref:flagellar hook assembly protein FlgD n=1 Tax=Limnohabitans sp. TaxID=1907725 RepID=UPI00286F652F|nr:flagellar hook capping FlgD N-terminal domain-containing protein [Limnohabitans sp.]